MSIKYSEHTTEAEAKNIIAAIEMLNPYPWVGKPIGKGIHAPGAFVRYAEPKYNDETGMYYAPAPDWADKLEGVQVATSRGTITVTRDKKVTLESDGTVKPVADVKGKVIK